MLLGRIVPGARLPPGRADGARLTAGLAAGGAAVGPVRTGLGAAAPRAFLAGRSDAGAEGAALRGRLAVPAPPATPGLETGAPSLRGRLGAPAFPAGAEAPRAVSLPGAEGRPGPGFPEGLARFAAGRAAPAPEAGLAPKWEGPDFPGRLFVGMGNSLLGQYPAFYFPQCTSPPPGG